MAVPPESILRAAARWLKYLPASDVARTRALFVSHARFGDLTPTQYSIAFDWLEGKRLSERLGSSRSINSAVFASAIEDSLWFADADILIDSADALPEDAHSAAAVLGLTDDDAHAIIRSAWGKVDVAQRSELGAAGEAALVRLLSLNPNLTVRQVSQESDGYGYDIDAFTTRAVMHLEVKSTTRRGRLRIYLSRNEYETMLRDAAWALVAVRLDPELQVAAIATIQRGWLLNAAPRDLHLGGRWESVRLDVPRDAVEPGIRPMHAAVPGLVDPRLRGEPLWPG